MSSDYGKWDFCQARRTLEEVGISLDFRITFERKKGWYFVAKDGKDNGLREGTTKQRSQTNSLCAG